MYHLFESEYFSLTDNALGTECFSLATFGAKASGSIALFRTEASGSIVLFRAKAAGSFRQIDCGTILKRTL